MAFAIGVATVATASIVSIATATISHTVVANSVELGTAAPPPPMPRLGEVEGGFNLLLVGTDNDATQGEQYGEREGTLNDVNIVLRVAEDHSSATVVSLPRDLIVDRPECVDEASGELNAAASNVPLNSTFSSGGLACVNETVQQLTGLIIPYAGWISFNGVIEMSNAIGGVPVCLTGPVQDPNSGLDLSAGTSTISGTTALAFLRSRHGVGDGSDLARIASQQQYMSSLMRRMRSAETLTNFGTMYALARAASLNMHLSTSLTNPSTMIALAMSVKDLDLSRMVFVQYPGSTSDPDFPGKVVPDVEVAAVLMDAIANDRPITLDAPQPIDQGEGADDAAAPADEPAAAAPPAPQPLEGVSGQTAAEQTCASPSD